MTGIASYILLYDSIAEKQSIITACFQPIYQGAPYIFHIFQKPICGSYMCNLNAPANQRGRL